MMTIDAQTFSLGIMVVLHGPESAAHQAHSTMAGAALTWHISAAQAVRVHKDQERSGTWRPSWQAQVSTRSILQACYCHSAQCFEKAGTLLAGHTPGI